MRPDGRRDGEGEPHRHARAVETQRQLHELAEIGEAHHVLHHGGDGGAAHAVIHAAQHDVFPAGQVAVHAGMHVQQRADGAVHTQPPGDRLIDAGQRAQQGGLARTVASDEAEPLARSQREGEPAQRVHHHPALRILVQPARCGRGDGLLQRSCGAVIERERHVQVAHLDAGHRLRPSRRGARARG